MGQHYVVNGGGGGVTGTQEVRALAIFQNELYAGGRFYQIGGHSISRIARWDGNDWHEVGGGIPGTNIEVYDLAVYKGELYAGGYFTVAGDTTAYNIARWDGVNWKPVGNGLDGGTVVTLFVDTVEDILYAGGGFWGEVNGQEFIGLGKWDGEQWSNVGGFNYGGVWAIERYHDEIYVAGSIDTVISNGQYLKEIARWNGWEWKNVGDSLNHHVKALEVYHDTLFVGGYFTQAGNLAANHIVKWWAPYDSTLAIKEPLQSKELKIYPNPNTGQVTLEWPAIKTTGFISVTNLEGKETERIQITPQQTKLSLSTSQWAKGVYTVVLLQNEAVIARRKIVIE